MHVKGKVNNEFNAFALIITTVCAHPGSVGVCDQPHNITSSNIYHNDYIEGLDGF